MVKLSHVGTFLLSLLHHTVTAEDSIPEACTAQFNALTSCTADLPDIGVTCLACWGNSLPQDATDCSDGESKFCAAYQSCSCGECDLEILNMTDCLVDQGVGGEGCQIDCTTATFEPSKPVTDVSAACPDEFNALFLCAIGSSDGGDTCLDCWSKAIPDEVMDCNEGQSKICGASKSCECGSCNQEIIAFTDCLVDQVVGGEGCQIDCESSGSPDPGVGVSGVTTKTSVFNILLVAAIVLALGLV